MTDVSDRFHHFHHSGRPPGGPGGPGGPVLADGDFLVSFDVSSDRSRRAVGKALERFGPKLLYSVYGITVPRARLARLFARVNRLLESSDHALILPFCDRCNEAWWGQPFDAAPPGGWIAR